MLTSSLFMSGNIIFFNAVCRASEDQDVWHVIVDVELNLSDYELGPELGNDNFNLLVESDTESEADTIIPLHFLSSSLVSSVPTPWRNTSKAQ